MAELKNYHMSVDDFRRCGRALVDWIADYYEQIESLPVLSRVQPGHIRATLPGRPPRNGEAFEDILQDVTDLILPGVTHWQSPNFFAFFPANASGPAILGDLLSSGLGVQGMLWATSPACTELESHMLDWLVDMLDLPDKFLSTSPGGGVIQDTASSAALCALLAARERATGFAVNEYGADGRLSAYASDQAHSSIEKAVKIAGIGRENLRLIAVDDNFAMRPDLLARQIEEDFQAGRRPCFVAATVGTTSSGGIDPLSDIGRICRENNIWLHVDGAMAGTAALCPEFRWIHRGLEMADSYCFNPHKWMFTNFDCSAYFVRDREPLIRSLEILPEYLKTKEGARVNNYRDWGIQLGRRFRALKLWFVIRSFGASGIREKVRNHLQWVQELAAEIEISEDFELLAPVPFATICFRYKPKGVSDLDTLNRLNQQLMESLNDSGKLYLTHTKLNGIYTLRLVIGQTNV
ncbi:MAG: aminotransferase class V-fold PLP-dependent enzyme, partial [Desulfobacterales bacterium]